MWQATRKDNQTPVFKTSIDAFGAELENFFPDRKTSVFLLKQQGDMDEVKTMDKVIKPPFFTYRLSDLSYKDDGAPNERRQRWGVQSGGPLSSLDEQGRPTDPNKNYTRLSPVNVDLNCNIDYNCDFIQQIEFSEIWMRRAVKPIKFILSYSDIEVSCLITLDKNITYSDIDFDREAVVSCQTTAILNTWVIGEGRTRPISQYTVSEKVLAHVAKEDADKPGRAYTNQEFIVNSNSWEPLP